MQENTIYVATEGAVRALDLQGNLLWAHFLDASDANINAGPVVARIPTRPEEEPFVFYGTQGGTLQALQARVRSSLCYNAGI